MAEKKQTQKKEAPRLTADQFVTGAPLSERDKYAARIVLKSKYDGKKTRESWKKVLKEKGFNI